MRKPNPISVGDYKTEEKTFDAFGFLNGKTKTVSKKYRLFASKEKSKIQEYKN